MSARLCFIGLVLMMLGLASIGLTLWVGWQLSAATRLPVEAQWRTALVESGVPAAVADDLLWLTLSIVRGLAIRRLWQHDPPRFNRLFRTWREMVAAYLASLEPPGKRGASSARQTLPASATTAARTPARTPARTFARAPVRTPVRR